MWTNIEHDKPDTGVNVLVAITPNEPSDADDNPKIEVGHLMTDNYTWIIGGRFGFDVGKVTHWQHLPEPPTE